MTDNIDMFGGLFSNVIKQPQNSTQTIPIDKLTAFKNHPFDLYDKVKENEMVEGIKENGVITPIIVRPNSDGGYEVISGHNRVHCARIAGLTEIPANIQNVDDDTAILMMVQCNLQREQIKPSEKAKAYKMQIDAIKRQGQRRDLTSCHVDTKSENETSCHTDTKFRADETLAKNSTDSARTIQRYIRLTYLIPELLQMVDDKKLSRNFGEDLSYLDMDFQEVVADLLYTGERLNKDSVSKLKGYQEKGTLTEELVENTIKKVKSIQSISFSVPARIVKKYNLPEDKDQRENIIDEALKMYYKTQEESDNENN